MDSSVHLIYHDPSDLGSLILIRISSQRNAPLDHLLVCLYSYLIGPLFKVITVITVSNTDYVYLCLDRFSPSTITTLQNMDLEKIDLGLLVRVIKHISLQMEVHNKNS